MREVVEFEKQCVIRSSLGDMGGVLVSVACQRGWRGSMDSVLPCVAWIGWVASLCGWRASVGAMLLLLLLLLFIYHLEEKFLNIYFWNKNEKKIRNRSERWFLMKSFIQSPDSENRNTLIIRLIQELLRPNREYSKLSLILAISGLW